MRVTLRGGNITFVCVAAAANLSLSLALDTTLIIRERKKKNKKNLNGLFFLIIFIIFGLRRTGSMKILL